MKKWHKPARRTAFPRVLGASPPRGPAAPPTPDLPPLALITTGTPGGGWQALAEGLLEAAPKLAHLRHPGLGAWLDGWAGSGEEPARITEERQEALRAIAPADTAAWGASDARACWVLDILAAVFPQARFLIFVASPAAALADWLAGPAVDDTTPADVLARWQAGGARILRHVQRHAGRCLLISAQEAAVRTDELAALAGDSFGLPFLAFAPVPGPEPVHAALAASLAATDRAVAALHTELLASCAPIGGAEDDLTSVLAFDAALAARSFRGLVLEAAEVVTLRSSIEQAQQAAADAQEQVRQLLHVRDGLRDDLDATARANELLLAEARQTADAATRRAGDAAQRLADAERRWAAQTSRQEAGQKQLAAERDALLAARDAAARLAEERQAQLETALRERTDQQRETELLLLNLRRVQEELETDRLKLRAAEGRLADAEARGEAVRKQAAELEAQADAATTARKAVTDELEGARARLASAQEEGELLLLQLHQVQEELEKSFLEQEAGRKQMAAERGALLAARDAAARLAEERQAQLETALRERTDQQRETELLLLNLRRVQEELETDRLKLRAAEGRLADAEARLEEWPGRLAKVVAERDASARLAAERQGQQDALARETARLAAENAAAARAAAQHQAQIEALGKERARFAAEGEAARKHAAESAARADAATTAHKAVTDELEAARARLASAQEESELLLLQLHQVQEELEKSFLELQQLRQAPAEGPQPETRHQPVTVPQAGAALSVGRVEFDAPRMTPPHLELQCRLEDARFADAEPWTRLRLRLVEHHGKPGLVMFGDIARSPLEHWRESGQEDGQPFLLLVPADENTWPHLCALSPRDWGLVNALAGLLARRLRVDAPHLAPRWLGVAQRLQRELAELPPALRYQRVEAAAVPGALEIHLSPVHWGRRELPAVDLRVPAGDAGVVEFLLPEAAPGEPPLTQWPVDDAGAPLAKVVLQLGSASGDRTAAHAAWMALSTADRAFVQSLLSCLPDVVAAMPASPEKAAGVERLTALARAAACAGAAPPPARRLMRRLLGRYRSIPRSGPTSP